MCPACFASAAMLVAGVVSTSGLAALALKVRGKSRGKKESEEVEVSERESEEKP